MSSIARHAIYWVPRPGPLAARGAAWLGWDAEAGAEVPHPAIPGLPRPLHELTAEPRRYGLHATLKPPFRLAEGADARDLPAAIAALARRLPPATAPSLGLAPLGAFLTLAPEGDAGALAAVAQAAVEGLDAFRAPPSEAELARRRAPGLSPSEEANLLRWGYPFVGDRFRFHVTLAGPLAPGEAPAVEAALRRHLGDALPRPFALDALAHAGEGPDGRFRVLHRYPLSG